MRASEAKRSAVETLRRLVEPILYQTAVPGVKLYLFQHAPGGNRDFYGDKHDFDKPEVGISRTINDLYKGGRNDGREIVCFHGFYGNGIVDDISGGVTFYAFRDLSLPTLRSLIKLVRQIRTYKLVNGVWVRSESKSGAKKPAAPKGREDVA